MSDQPRSTKDLIDRAQSEGEYTEIEAQTLKSVWDRAKHNPNTESAYRENMVRTDLSKAFGPLRAKEMISILQRRTAEVRQKSGYPMNIGTNRQAGLSSAESTPSTVSMNSPSQMSNMNTNITPQSLLSIPHQVSRPNIPNARINNPTTQQRSNNSQQMTPSNSLALPTGTMGGMQSTPIGGGAGVVHNQQSPPLHQQQQQQQQTFNTLTASSNTNSNNHNNGSSGGPMGMLPHPSQMNQYVTNTHNSNAFRPNNLSASPNIPSNNNNQSYYQNQMTGMNVPPNTMNNPMISGNNPNMMNTSINHANTMTGHNAQMYGNNMMNSGNTPVGINANPNNMNTNNTYWGMNNPNVNMSGNSGNTGNKNMMSNMNTATTTNNNTMMNTMMGGNTNAQNMLPLQQQQQQQQLHQQQQQQQQYYNNQFNTMNTNNSNMLQTSHNNNNNTTISLPHQQQQQHLSTTNVNKSQQQQQQPIPNTISSTTPTIGGGTSSNFSHMSGNHHMSSSNMMSRNQSNNVNIQTQIQPTPLQRMNEDIPMSTAQTADNTTKLNTTTTTNNSSGVQKTVSSDSTNAATGIDKIKTEPSSSSSELSSPPEEDLTLEPLPKDSKTVTLKDRLSGVLEHDSIKIEEHMMRKDMHASVTAVTTANTTTNTSAETVDKKESTSTASQLQTPPPPVPSRTFRWRTDHVMNERVLLPIANIVLSSLVQKDNITQYNIIPTSTSSSSTSSSSSSSSSNESSTSYVLSAQAYETLSSGLQMHIVNIIEDTLRISRRRRNRSTQNSYSILVSTVDPRNNSQSSTTNKRTYPLPEVINNIGMKFGPNIIFEMSQEEVLSRSMLARLQKELDVHLTEELIEYDKKRTEERSQMMTSYLQTIGSKKRATDAAINAISEKVEKELPISWWEKEKKLLVEGSMGYDEYILFNLKQRVAAAKKLGYHAVKTPYETIEKSSKKDEKATKKDGTTTTTSASTGDKSAEATTDTAVKLNEKGIDKSGDKSNTTAAAAAAAAELTARSTTETPRGTDTLSTTTGTTSGSTGITSSLPPNQDGIFLSRIQKSLAYDQHFPFVDTKESYDITTRDMIFVLSKHAYSRGRTQWSQRVGHSLQLAKLGIFPDPIPPQSSSHTHTHTHSHKEGSTHTDGSLHNMKKEESQQHHGNSHITTHMTADPSIHIHKKIKTESGLVVEESSHNTTNAMTTTTMTTSQMMHINDHHLSIPHVLPHSHINVTPSTIGVTVRSNTPPIVPPNPLYSHNMNVTNYTNQLPNNVTNVTSNISSNTPPLPAWAVQPVSFSGSIGNTNTMNPAFPPNMTSQQNYYTSMQTMSNPSMSQNVSLPQQQQQYNTHMNNATYNMSNNMSHISHQQQQQLQHVQQPIPQRVQLPPFQDPSMTSQQVPSHPSHHQQQQQQPPYHNSNNNNNYRR